MKRFSIVCLIALLWLGFVSVNAFSADVIKLRFSTWMQPIQETAITAENFCKDIEKKTDGRIKISFHPGATLVPANQSYEGVIKGITDIAMITQQYNAGRFPLTEGLYLPLGAKDAVQATKMMQSWHEKFKPKEYDEVKVLFLFASGPGQFTTLKPIASIKDLKGLKVRAAGETAKIVSAMGAVPVSIPLAESYDGFQRGIIAGSVLPVESLKSWRFADLLRGYQVNPGMAYASALGVVINKDKWNSISPNDQKIIEALSKEYAMTIAVAWDKVDKEGLDLAKSKGLKVSVISPAEVEQTRKLMKPIINAYIENMKKLGLPGAESVKFCQDFIKKN